MAKDHDNIVEEMMGEARNTRLTPRKWWGMLGRCRGTPKKTDMGREGDSKGH
jgi:hypothetical protein